MWKEKANDNNSGAATESFNGFGETFTGSSDAVAYPDRTHDMIEISSTRQLRGMISGQHNKLLLDFWATAPMTCR